MIPGIDLAGTVIASGSADHRVGDRVVVNGWEMSQSHHRRPRATGARAWRVAGQVAGRDQHPRRHGDRDGGLYRHAVRARARIRRCRARRGGVLVTGVSGGVGSIATVILAKLGYRVVVSTGRPEEEDYLRALGAAEIINRASLFSGCWIGWAGTLGRSSRHRREPHARKRAGADGVSRRRRRVRLGSGHRSAWNGASVHPEVGDLGRNRTPSMRLKTCASSRGRVSPTISISASLRPRSQRSNSPKPPRWPARCSRARCADAPS